jgi:predicted aspartyl protease
MAVFQYPVSVFDAAGNLLETIDLWVDTGSSYTWLPASVRDRLRMQPTEERSFVLANGVHERRPVAQVRISLGGPPFGTYCAFAEDGDAWVLGAIALEEAGLAADPVHQRLIPADSFRF